MIKRSSLGLVVLALAAAGLAPRASSAADLDTTFLQTTTAGGFVDVVDCSFTHKYAYITNSACTHINSGDNIWDPNWQINGARPLGRGFLQVLYQIPCGHAAANVIYHARNTGGGDSGNNYTVNTCPLNGYYFTVNGAVGDVGAFSSFRVNGADAGCGSGCGSTCGASSCYQLGLANFHYINTVWRYIN